jgi:DNA-binding CsgD family transcriptional regulator
MQRDVIGRGPELEAIERFLRMVPSGAAALVLDGDAGIGKTTLWETAVSQATTAGFRVLTARPSAAEADLSLGAFHDLFAPVTGDPLRRLPGPQRQALDIALLRTESGGVAIDQGVLSFATTNLLRDLADSGPPVLVAIDDVQWLDPTSAAIVAFAARRVREQAVGFLVSRRSAAAAPAPLGLHEAMREGRSEHLRIGPLAMGELHQVLVTRLGQAFPRLALIRIQEASGGNPFYAVELGRALLDAGATVAAGEPLPAPPTLEGLIGRRLATLPPASRRLLLLAAAAIEPTLATLTRAGASRAREGIRPAVAAGMVDLDGDAVRFSHPLVASAVIASVEPDDLRQAHARLAEAAASEEVRARHLGLAAEGPDEAVAEALEHAAESARARGATADAASLYERAAALTPDELVDRATDRAITAAECLFVDIADHADADAVLERAIRRAPPGPSRADALSFRAVAQYYFGRYPAAIGMCEQALAEAGDDPLLRAKVLVRMSYLSQLDQDRSLAVASEAVSLLEERGEDVDPDLLADALLMRATSGLLTVRGYSADDVERGTALITSDVRSAWQNSASGTAFGLARLTDDLDRAIAIQEESQRRTSGLGGDDQFGMLLLAGLWCQRGDWTLARQLAEAALEGYARETEGGWTAWAMRGAAFVAAHQGRVDEARRWATDGLAIARAGDDLIVAMMHLQILGFVALSVGEFREAEEHLAEAAAMAEQTGQRHPGRFKFDGDRVEAALALGDIELAGRIVGRLEHAGAAAPTPWVLAVGGRCRGLLEAARGDLEAAAKALEGSVEEHTRLPMPFERARTLLVKGQIHRRRKEKRAADQTLREALAVFADLGAPLWAERARAELGRVGLRPRAPTGLTDTERRVAELAAQGLSSREIAHVAFLAPKTVGNVLSRVYRKLGIGSRAELGAVMARSDAPPTDGGTGRD